MLVLAVTYNLLRFVFSSFTLDVRVWICSFNSILYFSVECRLYISYYVANIILKESLTHFIYAILKYSQISQLIIYRLF